MQFNIIINHPWLWFCVGFALVQITSLWMQKLGNQLKTRDGSLHKFSIMDLEFPSSAQDMVNVINGIYRMPEMEIKKCLKALKFTLIVDFLFMPAIYGCIFLLCMHVAHKTMHINPAVFETLAWLQVFAWLCDIFENAYILRKIHPDSTPSGKMSHAIYTAVVYSKWGIALIGGICASMAIFYFWLSGRYNPDNLFFAMVLIAEIVGFFILKSVLNKFVKTKA